MDDRLADDWTHARRKLIKEIGRADRERYDSLVLDLLRLVEREQPADPEAARVRGLLRVGVATATALLRYAPADLELLAAAAVLPWFDDALLGSRAQLLPSARAMDWTGAMLLAMAPATARSIRAAGDAARTGYLRQVGALPPLLRAAVLLERHFAAGVPEISRLAFASARPFSQAELAELALGVPAALVPPAGPRVAGGPAAPLQPPVGSPAEALSLVRENLLQPFGGYRLTVDGDPGFVIDGYELIYQVHWDVPLDRIRPFGPPVHYPGDPPPVLFTEPGWLVDRVTREVHPVDLRAGAVAAYVSPRRVYPLPPGWRPESRPSLLDGFAAQLAALLPPPAAGALLGEATARYGARLAAGDWPDHLLALRVAGRTVRTLASAGFTDPHTVAAAVMAACGPGADDTLLDPDSEHWRSRAGELALAVRPTAAELDGAGAARRAARLTGAPVPVRALVIANAGARAAVEHELFGTLPRARRDELVALGPLTHDLPGILRDGLPVG